MDGLSLILGVLGGVLLAIISAAIYTYREDRKKVERQFDYEKELPEDVLDPRVEGALTDVVGDLVDQVNVLTDAFRSLNEDVSHLYQVLDEDDDPTQDPMPTAQVSPITVYPGEVLTDEEAQMLGTILKDHIDRRKSTTGH